MKKSLKHHYRDHFLLIFFLAVLSFLRIGGWGWRWDLPTTGDEKASLLQAILTSFSNPVLYFFTTHLKIFFFHPIAVPLQLELSQIPFKLKKTSTLNKRAIIAYVHLSLGIWRQLLQEVTYSEDSLVEGIRLLTANNASDRHPSYPCLWIICHDFFMNVGAVLCIGWVNILHKGVVAYGGFSSWLLRAFTICYCMFVLRDWHMVLFLCLD